MEFVSHRGGSEDLNSPPSRYSCSPTQPFNPILPATEREIGHSDSTASQRKEARGVSQHLPRKNKRTAATQKSVSPERTLSHHHTLEPTANNTRDSPGNPVGYRALHELSSPPSTQSQQDLPQTRGRSPRRRDSPEGSATSSDSSPTFSEVSMEHRPPQTNSP